MRLMGADIVSRLLGEVLSFVSVIPPPDAPRSLDDEKLMADVEQFLYFHRSADLTAEVLKVRLLLAMFKLLKSMRRDSQAPG